jgi:hypothetical protein
MVTSIFFEENFRHLANFFIQKICQNSPLCRKIAKKGYMYFLIALFKHIVQENSQYRKRL